MTVTAIINGKEVPESELHHYCICDAIVSHIIYNVNARVTAQNEQQTNISKE